MRKNIFILFTCLLAIILLVIFHSYFSSTLVTSGDWVYYYPQGVHDAQFLAAWDWRHDGLGASILPTLWLESYFIATIKISLILGWGLYEKIFWFLPFLAFSIISSYLLAKKVTNSKLFSLLAPLIYSANTYILMVMGGGQVGVGLAYSFAPFVILSFLNTVENTNLSTSFVLGLMLAVETIFDIRLSYIVIIALFLSLLFFIFSSKEKKNLRTIFYCFILPGIVTAFINAFWLLPVAVVGRDAFNQFGTIYSSNNAVSYFSFAKFENSIGLLHPYWPDNIFGKVSFMKPEFLLLPLFAFASLFFINKKNVREGQVILLFALLGLIGAFLAKGTTDPFGGIYLWMFNHVPGFVMFRDPTKWYLLVALSYSVLIPLTVVRIYEFLLIKVKKSKYYSYGFIAAVVLSLLFLIKPALFGQLNGTFKAVQVPSEYQQLANYLSHEPQGRTLWVPTTQRFAYNSENNPAVSAQDIFGIYDQKKLIKKLHQPGTEKFLQDAGIQYVIVPIDFQHEIFLADRQYSEKVYDQTLWGVSEIPWLNRLWRFGNLAVFEVPTPKDHIWSPNPDLQIDYSVVSPTKYTVTVDHAKKGDRLVFSETYDRHWIGNITNDNVELTSVKYDGILNSFILPTDGNYTFTISYTPQTLVNVGAGVSALSIVCIIIVIISQKKKGKTKKI